MTGQRHGKQFEDLLKALLFSGASDQQRSPTARFDIEAGFDEKFGLPTSVKASKHCLTVALADARAFWSVQEPFRLMAACWRQEDEATKVFYEVHEFIIHGAMLGKLRGAVTLEQITALHEGIGLGNFPAGSHHAARVWAQTRKKEIARTDALITLNPKIDSKSQRRLQCSVRMAVLRKVADTYPPYLSLHPNHQLWVDSIGSMVLPQRIRSSPRHFSGK